MSFRSYLTCSMVVEPVVDLVSSTGAFNPKIEPITYAPRLVLKISHERQLTRFKVTTDPAGTQNPVTEGAGTVTSDSLAAESANKGGSFGGVPSKQPSASTTTNTTDTSNAKELPPAADGTARKAATGELDEPYKGAHPSGKDAGSGPTYNADTTSSSSQPAAGQDGTFDHASGTAAFGKGGESGVGKPKGTNLTEGGFQGDEPNASYNTDIGSENDPGRAALGKLQRMTDESAVDAGNPTRQKEVETGTGGYDALKETSA